MDELFLRSDIQVEPLVHRWYAWSHLIPPATAARNVVHRHILIMESFLASPAAHEAAVKNPKMLGGPFLDLPASRADAIRYLVAATKQKQQPLFELAAAIADLNKMLEAEARGGPMKLLYSKVPACLQGYVELIYDLNDHPGFRFVEPLLYRSRFYQPDLQSLMLTRLAGDERPFVLSTPRMDSADSFHLGVSFNDQRVDWLFESKKRPREWQEIISTLSVDKTDLPLLRSLFTGQKPAEYIRYSGAGIRWRYFGHACILIEGFGRSILLDPVLSYTFESTISRYTYDDLPDVIDYVLITHNHQDHVLFETLLQIRHKVRTVVVPASGNGRLQDPSLKWMFQAVGFDNVVELKECETITCGDLRITGVPFFGEHADLDIQTKLGYSVMLGGWTLCFLADSCNIEPALYSNIKEHFGPVDALFLGMECDGAPLSWLYGPLMVKRPERVNDMARRLSGSDCLQGMRIVEALKPGEVYIYAMGQEPWLNYIMSLKYGPQSRPIVESSKLIEQCAQRGVYAERLFGERELLLEQRNSVHEKQAV